MGYQTVMVESYHEEERIASKKVI